MLISHKWLQEHFEKPIPSADELVDLLTMYAYEVENVEVKEGDSVIDIDVLPNRASDSLSHGGVARELSHILELPIKDAFAIREVSPISADEKLPTALKIDLAEPQLCRRYVGRRVEGVAVGPSPDWLVEHLEALGQRSINNIVDITNYVMLETGQPMHAFDADKVAKGSIVVRMAKEGEKFTSLDGKELGLDDTMLVITDGTREEGDVLALAGVKGGKHAEVDEKTTSIILESANFAGANTRKTARKVGIHTDSSKRFENGITPELALSSMELATALVAKYAEGSVTVVHPVADEYPRRAGKYLVGVSTAEVNQILGTHLLKEDVEKILNRFGWEYKMAHPIETAVKEAGQYVGVPYKYGASITYDAPRAFDCSSFTSFLYVQGGVAIPRMTVDQYVFGYPIEKEDLVAGDIVFAQNDSEDEEIEVVLEESGEKVTQAVRHTVTKEFLPGTEVAEGVDHNGLYLGDGKVIHASGKWYKGEVVLEDLDSSPAFKNIRGYRRMMPFHEERFVVTVPDERLDIRIKEDLVEEIGRMYGYKNIEGKVLDTSASAPVNKQFYYANLIRNKLVSQGFSEVFTYGFVNKGELEVQNPMASDKAFLRSNLTENLTSSLEFNTHHADLLGVDQIKIFEIGNVFDKDGEHLALGIGIQDTNKKKNNKVVPGLLEELVKELFADLGASEVKGTMSDSHVFEINLGKVIEELPDLDSYGDELATESGDVKYKSISPFPHIARDIAVFVSVEVTEAEVSEVLTQNAGPLLAREPRLFDVFKKTLDDGTEKVSYAFRLVFQSYEKTLTDEEINTVMETINDVVIKHGWEVR